MGKLVFISGENSSGKSRFAESLVEKTSGRRLYIATMKAVNKENEERIRRHRKQRAGLGFETLELPYNVGKSRSEGSLVLLEDVSNLFANCFFEKKGSCETVFRDICELKKKCSVLIAVSIDGLSPQGYDGETAEYINGLNALNGLLLKEADCAIHMEKGQARQLKGELDDIF